MVLSRSGRAVLWDLFRQDTAFLPSELELHPETWKKHLKCSCQALSSCDVLIITVGLNEVFKWLPTGHYLHTTPRPQWVNPALWEPEVLSVEQNIAFLSEGIAILRKHNPNVKIICSLSPVPLLKTFRRDEHVVAATAHSKAVLRVALEQLSKTITEFYYMPSFETVMYPGNGVEVWEEDGRHVTRPIVAKIMSLFERQFCHLVDSDMSGVALSSSQPQGIDGVEGVA